MLMILLSFSLPSEKQKRNREQRTKSKEQRTNYLCCFFAAEMIKLGNHHTILNLISLLFRQWHTRDWWPMFSHLWEIFSSFFCFSSPFFWLWKGQGENSLYVWKHRSSIPIEPLPCSLAQLMLQSTWAGHGYCWPYAVLVTIWWWIKCCQLIVSCNLAWLFCLLYINHWLFLNPQILGW